uniref:Uncharacterized protein n=1 Tax=Piliocolobus tephrosceles TaxID=591936 RepID=A0A8C9HN21_9PRIM
MVGLRLVKTTWNGVLMGPAPWSSRPPGIRAGFPKSLFSPMFDWGLVQLLPLVDSQLSTVNSSNCTQEWGQCFYLQIKQASLGEHLSKAEMKNVYSGTLPFRTSV